MYSNILCSDVLILINVLMFWTHLNQVIIMSPYSWWLPGSGKIQQNSIRTLAELRFPVSSVLLLTLSFGVGHSRTCTPWVLFLFMNFSKQIQICEVLRTASWPLTFSFLQASFRGSYFFYLTYGIHVVSITVWCSFSRLSFITDASDSWLRIMITSCCSSCFSLWLSASGCHTFS